MQIIEKKIPIRALVEYYFENEETDQVVGYGKKLNIRPAYQRQLVYEPAQQEKVIDTILKKRPINIFYWAEVTGGAYPLEVMDGQQRIMSICHFYNNQGVSVEWNGVTCNFDSLPSNVQKDFLDYEITVEFCNGTDEEKLEWFKTINIAGMKLTDQELRNATFTGRWLEDAKKYFSKRNCKALKSQGATGKELFGDFLSFSNEDCIRQDLLEKALEWIVDYENIQGDSKAKKIEQYMANHKGDADAHELIEYYEKVMNWAKRTFKVFYKQLMKGKDWGTLYNKYHQNTYDPDVVSARIQQLLTDKEVQNKKGIVDYILSGNENKLNLRAFDDDEKLAKYEEQKHICPKCKQEFKYEEMEGDHIVPWSKGGKTEYDNLQMLCKKCNGRKSDK